MSKLKTCIITGSRAEWGLFYPLASELKSNSGKFGLQIIATGGHLLKEYGLTYTEIEEDGFKISEKVKIPFEEATEQAVVKAVSLGAVGISRALGRLKPDIVLLLGDRFETFSAALACLFLKIPIAHIHGGELTEGSLDDSLRHAITKMAHLHFVSTEIYRKRVIQMGEEPSRVFNVGALALDNIKNTVLLEKEELEKKIKFRLGEKNIIVTFNPLTAERKFSSEAQFKDLLSVIDEWGDVKVIFTKPNPDMYSKTIAQLMDKYVSSSGGRCAVFASMGRTLYLSALRFMTVAVGNSSSGIIEVPSFGIPTVNIGDRQKGRIKAGSIIDCGQNKASISAAIKKAFSEDFQKRCKKVKNPYDGGNASKGIVQALERTKGLKSKKSFFDLGKVQMPS